MGYICPMPTVQQKQRSIPSTIVISQVLYYGIYLSYAHSTTKTKINSIYNSHFTGSVLWDLFGREADMIYNTWNSSIRKMFRSDRTTHRYFIEPISKTLHCWNGLWTSQMNWCVQERPRHLFNIIRNECRSTTGRNLRKIIYYCGKNRISEITPKEISEKSYHPSPLQEIWRLDLVNELLEIRDNNYDLKDWETDEVIDCINFLCTT